MKNSQSNQCFFQAESSCLKLFDIRTHTYTQTYRERNAWCFLRQMMSCCYVQTEQQLMQPSHVKNVQLQDLVFNSYF